MSRRVALIAAAAIAALLCLGICACKYGEEAGSSQQESSTSNYSVDFGSSTSGSSASSSSSQQSSSQTGNGGTATGTQGDTSDSTGQGKDSSTGTSDSSSGGSSSSSGQDSGSANASSGNGGSSGTSSGSTTSPSSGSGNSGSGNSGTQTQIHTHTWSTRTVKTGEKWVVDCAAYNHRVKVGSDYVCATPGCGINFGDDGEALDEHMRVTRHTYKVEPRYETVHEDEIGHYEPVYGTEEYCTGCGAVK